MAKQTDANQMTKENHHWWPECVSDFWMNDDGKVNMVLPTGQVKPVHPKAQGVIKNGHFIKLGKTNAEKTPWDWNFESVFDELIDVFHP